MNNGGQFGVWKALKFLRSTHLQIGNNQWFLTLDDLIIHKNGMNICIKDFRHIMENRNSYKYGTLISVKLSFPKF